MFGFKDLLKLKYHKNNPEKHEETKKDPHFEYHKKLNASSVSEETLQAFFSEPEEFLQAHLKQYCTFELLRHLDTHPDLRMHLLDKLIEEDKTGAFLKKIDLHEELKRFQFDTARLLDYVTILRFLWLKSSDLRKIINESNLQVSLLNELKEKVNRCSRFSRNNSIVAALRAYLEIPLFYSQHPYIPKTHGEVKKITRLLEWDTFNYPAFLRSLTVDQIEVIFQTGFALIDDASMQEGILTFLESLMSHYTQIISNSQKSAQDDAAKTLLKHIRNLSCMLCESDNDEKNSSHILNHYHSFKNPSLTLPAYIAYFHYYFESINKNDLPSYFEVIAMSFSLRRKTMENMVDIFLNIPEESLVFSYQQSGNESVRASIAYFYNAFKTNKSIKEDSILELRVLAKFARLEEAYKKDFTTQAKKTIETNVSSIDTDHIRLLLTASQLLFRFEPDYVHNNIRDFHHYALNVYNDPRLIEEIKDIYLSLPTHMQDLYIEFKSLHHFMNDKGEPIDTYRKCEITLSNPNISKAVYDEASLEMAKFILSGDAKNMQDSLLKNLLEEFGDDFELIENEQEEEQDLQETEKKKGKGKEKEKEIEIKYEMAPITKPVRNEEINPDLFTHVVILEYLISNDSPNAAELRRNVLQRLNANIINSTDFEESINFNANEQILEALKQYYQPLSEQINLPSHRQSAIKNIMTLTLNELRPLQKRKPTYTEEAPSAFFKPVEEVEKPVILARIRLRDSIKPPEMPESTEPRRLPRGLIN